MSKVVDTDVEVVTDEELRAAANRALEHAGLGLDELREQAHLSQFSSERARLAWFMVSPVADLLSPPS